MNFDELKLLCYSITLYFSYRRSWTKAQSLVLFHVEQWIDTHKCALGKFSEQAIESLHKEFDDFWESHFWDKKRRY